MRAGLRCHLLGGDRKFVEIVREQLTAAGVEMLSVDHGADSAHIPTDIDVIFLALGSDCDHEIMHRHFSGPVAPRAIDSEHQDPQTHNQQRHDKQTDDQQSNARRIESQLTPSASVSSSSDAWQAGGSSNSDLLSGKMDVYGTLESDSAGKGVIRTQRSDVPSVNATTNGVPESILEPGSPEPSRRQSPSVTRNRSAAADIRPLRVGVCLQNDHQATSLALAMCLDDLVLLPIDEQVLGRRIESYRDFGVAGIESQLRQNTLQTFEFEVEPRPRSPRTPGSEETGRVLLVGRTSPLHVQLSGILGPNRFMFAQTIDSALIQLASNPFHVVMLVAQEGGPSPEEFVERIQRSPSQREFVSLIAVGEDHVGSRDWLSMGFADVLSVPAAPEFLKLRLGFWSRYEEIRGGLTSVASIQDYPHAVDAQCHCYNYGFAAEYLKSRLAAQRTGELTAIIAVRLRGLSACNSRWSCAVGNRIVAEVAPVVARSVRAEDLFARVHGALFVIIMSVGVESQLASIGERMRRHVEGNLPLQDGVPVPVRVETESIICEGRDWTDLDLVVRRIYEKADLPLSA